MNLDIPKAGQRKRPPTSLISSSTTIKMSRSAKGLSIAAAVAVITMMPTVHSLQWQLTRLRRPFSSTPHAYCFVNDRFLIALSRDTVLCGSSRQSYAPWTEGSDREEDEKKQDERNTFLTYPPVVPVSLNQASMGKDISWLAAAANASSSPTTGREASSLSSYICSGVDMRLRAGNFDAGHPSLIEDTESKNRDAGSHSRPPQQAPSSSTCTTPCRQQDMTQEAASRKDPDPRPNEGECDDGNEVDKSISEDRRFMCFSPPLTVEKHATLQSRRVRVKLRYSCDFNAAAAAAAAATSATTSQSPKSSASSGSLSSATPSMPSSIRRRTDCFASAARAAAVVVKRKFPDIIVEHQCIDCTTISSANGGGGGYSGRIGGYSGSALEGGGGTEGGVFAVFVDGKAIYTKRPNQRSIFLNMQAVRTYLSSFLCFLSY